MTGFRVLAIGAHPDDIELGCGGTLVRHVAVGDEVTLLIMTDGQSGPGDVSRRVDEARAAAEIVGASVLFGGLMDGEVSSNRSTIGIIERAIDKVQPSVIYTHGESDFHQDHRAVCSATMSAARHSSTVWHYQSPSAQDFAPHVFVALDEESIHVKMEAINCHSTQVEGSSRVSFDALEASARYWGLKAGTRYAEAFGVSRSLVTPTGAGFVIGDRRRKKATGYTGVERRGASLPQYESLFAGLHEDIAELQGGA